MNARTSRRISRTSIWCSGLKAAGLPFERDVAKRRRGLRASASLCPEDARFLAVGLGAFAVALGVPSLASGCECGGEIRLVLYGQAEIGDGSVIVGFAGPDNAPAKIGKRVPAIEAECLFEIAQRRIILMFAHQYEAAFGIDSCVRGVETDGLAVVRKRPFIVTLQTAVLAAVVVGLGRIRIERDCLSVVGDRMDVVAFGLPGEGTGEIRIVECGI